MDIEFPARANQIAEEEKVASHEETTAYTDHQKILSTEKPDVVFTLNSLDAAIDFINDRRSNLGAVQN